MFLKYWQSEKVGALVKERASNCLILLYAGSESGYVSHATLIFKAGSAFGDYHVQMNLITLKIG